MPNTVISFLLVFIIILQGCNRDKKLVYSETKINPLGVHAAFYNSKATHCAIADDRGDLIITDAHLKVLAVIKAHQGSTTSSFFSTNDESIITGGSDGYLCVWDAKTFKKVSQVFIKFMPYTSIMGRTYLGCAGENGYIFFQNRVNGETKLDSLEKSGATFLYRVEEDSTVVIASGSSAYEYDITKYQLLGKYGNRHGAVYCVMPDSKKQHYVTASADSVVSVFERRSRNMQYESPKLNGEVYVACFSPADDMIAASTASGTIYFFDAETKKVLRKINAFTTKVNTIHFSPDGKSILAGSEGGGVKIFDVETGKLQYSLMQLE